MVRQVLLFKSSKVHLITAIIGSIAGIFLLLLAIQIYFDTTSVINKKDGPLSPDYMIINKPVSFANTVSNKRVGFTNEEIEDLRKQEFMRDLTTFTGNEYKVTVYTDENSVIPGVYGNLFFESVPDDFLDFDLKDWHWEEGDSVVPVAIQRDYISLYNFGFAPSQGYPQIPAKSIKNLSLQLRIRSKDTTKWMRCRIVGFSDRINSVLVPQNFMEWANEKYGSDTVEQKNSRLLLALKDPSDPKLFSYMQEHGYKANQEQSKKSKITFILTIILAVVGIVSILIILLAFVVFLLTFQQVITESADNIQTLLHLGFRHQDLSAIYIKTYGILTVGVSTTAFGLLIFVKRYLSTTLTNLGVDVGPGLHHIVYITGIAISILLIVLNSLNISSRVKRLGKPQ